MKKGLKVVSVIMLVLGIITLVLGIASIAMFNAVGDGGTEVKALIGLAAILVVAGGALDVIGGVLGLRAAKDSSRATAAVVFGALALICGLASIAMDFRVQNLFSCVIPVLYLVCAVGVKNGRE